MMTLKHHSVFHASNSDQKALRQWKVINRILEIHGKANVINQLTNSLIKIENSITNVSAEPLPPNITDDDEDEDDDDDDDDEDDPLGLGECMF